MGKKRRRRPVRLPPPSPDRFFPEPSPRARVASTVRGLSLAAAVSSIFLASCDTYEELSGVRTSYKIDESVWGSKDDSGKIREKYAESGWKVDDEGNITPAREKNKEMFTDKEFRGSDKKVGEKRARLSKKRIDGDAVDMPEYMSRQKDFAKKESKVGEKRVRESLRDKFRLKDRDQVADTRGKSWLEKLGLVDTDQARESGKKYKTSKNRELAKAWDNAMEPTPRERPTKGGFYRDSNMTIDDVKQLVSPGGVMR